MAKLVLGFGGRGKLLCCSYKKTTIIICSINFVAAVYILHSLYTSFFIFSNNAPSAIHSGKYTDDQIRRMEESIRIRKAAEPLELIKMVKEIKEDVSGGKRVVRLSRPLKQNIAEQILQRLKGLNLSATVSEQKEALEKWRNEKLEETESTLIGNETSNSTSSTHDSNTLKKVLESDWNILLEELGVWFPAEISNKEHKDIAEGEEVPDDIIAGRPLPSECHAELHTDYGGAAVRWGLTHHKESAADCCQACLDQAKNAKPGEMKCNIWVYCPSENGCHSPDIYAHKHQECWLKQADVPRVTYKYKYSQSYRNSHPSAPVFVPWLAGVTSP